MRRAWLALPSFAKINLSLEILGPRSDGFTEIRTVFQTVALHDRLRLRLTRRTGIRLLVSHGGAPAGRQNLVHQALTRGCRLIGWRGGVEVELEKTVPEGRGLGGGSSNAAVALLGLLRLTGAKVDSETLTRLCSGIGSDVPFFLHGGTALGVGRGEEVYPLADAPRRWCLLLSPEFGVSTALAYRWARRARLTPHRRAANIAGLGPLRGSLWATGNGFDPVIFPRFPQIGRWRSALMRLGAEWCALAGSGSTLAALFVQRRDAVKAAAQLAPPTAGLAGEGLIFLAETLSGAEYRRALGVKVPFGAGS